MYGLSGGFGLAVFLIKNATFASMLGMEYYCICFRAELRNIWSLMYGMMNVTIQIDQDK